MAAPRTVRELAAELEVLEHFDGVRWLAGHDYGRGQRWAELRRRRHALELRLELEHSVGAPEPTDRELADAYERVGAPRARRIELDIWRRDTPASRRTLHAWHQCRRLYVDRFERFAPTSAGC